MIVKVNKYHKPLLFVSCNLRIDTDISGINNKKLNAKLRPVNNKLSR